MASSDTTGAATSAALDPTVRQVLQRGVAIPAQPLALDRERKLDERRQRALSRYYLDAGAGGLAVGVHTTQFAIRDPKVGLFEPVLQLAKEELDTADAKRAAAGGEPLVRVGGICGDTAAAVREAALLRDLGYHAGLLSLAAMREADDAALLEHCRTVSETLPIVGFYLQPAVGGRVLSYSFWRELCETTPGLVAIKLAPFNRYRTFDVMRAVAESGRDDIALYTGNDDHIVLDLLTPYRFEVNGKVVERRMIGGLLGHWAVWTRQAVALLERCQQAVREGGAIDAEMLALAEQVTDANAAVFDAANDFHGVIAGVHEVLRGQGLLEGIWCLDENETLSPGQADELERVRKAYPHLIDDAFVAENRERWLSG